MKKVRIILAIISVLLIIAANLSLVLTRIKLGLPTNNVMITLIVFLNLGLLASGGFILYGTGEKDRDQVINAGALLAVSYTFITELISTCLIFSFIKDFPFITAFLTELLSFILYTVLALLTVLGILFKRKHNAEIRQKVNFIAEQEENILLIKNKADDLEIINKLTALKDKMHFSDPMSQDACREVENQIVESIRELDGVIYDEDKQKTTRLINEISGLIEKRNSICLRNK